MQDLVRNRIAKFFRLQIFLVLLMFCGRNAVSFEIHGSELYELRVKTIATGLNYPWGLDFLPDGGLVVTERTGGLRLFKKGASKSQVVEGLPKISVSGQGGLMDVVLHPNFSENLMVYFSFVGGEDGFFGTEVARAKLIGSRLVDTEVIFQASPKSKGGRHFGSRLVFLGDKTLLVSLGDRGHRPNGQDLKTHPGSIIRITEDGGTPPDNPFNDNKAATDEIFTYGNRNVQGLFWDALNGLIWATEHGPQGGCELNLIKPGKNYGWADITFGKNYIIGTKIGEGFYREDVESPIFQWTPSNAPSGLTMYRGEKFPAWVGNLFVGSLKLRLLSRLILDDRKVVKEERLLEDKIGRIRTVRTGPDGFLYILTDDDNGDILRIEPHL